jgi:hypothetical protein
VKIIAAGTIYALFSSFLLFPYMGVPRRLPWAAMTLLTLELFALGLYSYFGVETGRALATVDVPLLSAALIVLGMMHAGGRLDEDPRHGLARQGRRRDRSRAQ